MNVLCLGRYSRLRFYLNIRRDVPAERLYRVLGFTHVPHLPEICCSISIGVLY
jgi:hypothetical protein